ncbi:Hypothetical predicted protein [Pelobates cultripes]|uniref:Rubicon Homology domain-containing protein n=1 Tax=Pelobates cultripes TaxID=61616 RepID=A0AAD1VQR3_PELCU|nr:Hypothetical predicted protein [Pelobates cultripes]
MAVSNPINMMPRTQPVLFPEDELPRPAVIGLDGCRGLHASSATAIKEILASVLNLPSNMKSKLSTNMEFQDSDLDNLDSSSNGDSDTDSSSCVRIISGPLDDIRFNRPTACWDNSQMDSPTSSTLELLPLSPRVPILSLQNDVTEQEISTLPKCGACTTFQLAEESFPSQMNVPLQMGIQWENRRFSSPNLSSPIPNLDQSTLNLTFDLYSMPINNKTEELEKCDVEDHKLSHRRSQSYSSILTASNQILASRAETLHPLTENVFEPTVNLENENEHFLVADMFIAAVEKIKSNLAYEQWKVASSQAPYWITKKPKDICFHRKKCNSESTISIDSGYGAQQSSLPATPILEEKTEISKSDEPCEDYDDEFVIIELEDYEKLCTPASKLHDNTPENPEPGFNSAQQTAKKLYRVLRRQWQQIEEDTPDAASPNHCIKRPLMSKDTIPEEFESSLNLEEEIKKFKLREVNEWSPPRFQILNTIHPYIKRDFVVASQNYLCAGCGTKVEPSYTNRLRYCDYLGKYFCDCCHCYAESSIPARIILKWNFSKYYVSNFSKNLLENIWENHKFNVQCENPDLYRKVRELNRVKDVKEQLIQLKRFLRTCRFADRIGVLKMFEEVPIHLTEELHQFTLSDLIKVKQGLLLPALRQILASGIAHVEICELCQANGFICEFCQGDDILFPFQSEKCARCDELGCKACFHKKCFKAKDCPKCRRIEAREALLRCESPAASCSPQC